MWKFQQTINFIRQLKQFLLEVINRGLHMLFYWRLTEGFFSFFFWIINPTRLVDWTPGWKIKT